jgi:cbb3-type cytochrome oxidase subunit 3
MLLHGGENMEFFLGLFTAIVFFCCILFAFWMGLRTSKKTAGAKPIDEEEQRKAKELHKDFMNVMNYNENVALQRKKVK